MKRKLETRSVKEEILGMIQRMPDDCTLEDIQYRLYIRQMVEEGIADVDERKVVPHDEAKKRMREWLKSRGLA
jgi:hypothetical protein